DAPGTKCHDHDGAGDQAPDAHDHSCQKHGAMARPFHRSPCGRPRRSFADWCPADHWFVATRLMPCDDSRRQARETDQQSFVPARRGILGVAIRRTARLRMLRSLSARERPPRHLSPVQRGLRPLIAQLGVLAGVSIIATAFITYVLWPRWPGPVTDPD